MLGQKKNQTSRIIAVLEEIDDVSEMIKDYLKEYGYKSGVVSRLEINNPYEITVLQIDPNNLPDLKSYKLEAIVLNLKNPLVYRKEIQKLLKKATKSGALIGDKMALDKLEKKVPKNILVAKIDYKSEEENKPTHTFKYVGFYAEGITKSVYKYTDDSKGTDKTWKINNKYAYKIEALLFATINSCGLIN